MKKTIIAGIIIILRRLLNVLKWYREYEFEPVEGMPRFQYADESDQNLCQLRDTFKLDEIAGEVEEIQRIINLMHWVHQIVKWESWAGGISPQNTIDIFRVCRAEDRPVNCWTKSIILNEAYLSLGYKSRSIACFPRQDGISGCHVVTMVYSSQLKKWIYMDPSFNAYFVDEDGNLLDFREIRERLISNKPLFVNEDNTWISRIVSYKTYIADNFIRFSCSAVSAFDYGTADKDRGYIELVPKKLNLAGKRVMAQSDGYATKTYFTSNPDYFWAVPGNE
jgi:hypothetical protein